MLYAKKSRNLWAICSLINRGYDLFPFNMDIHGIVSTHVETVVLMTRTDARNG